MKRQKVILLVILFIALGTILLYTGKLRLSNRTVKQPASTPTIILTPEVTPPSSPSIATNIFYPMTQYQERITNRGYGKDITAADRDPLPCGDPFEGIHNGDDLETTASERNEAVPVFSIGRGTVRQVSDVGGYGGLIVIEHELKAEPVTAYYGHINLNKTTIKPGNTVQAGEQISILGDQCSTQTSNERKHLHFSIHKGTAIDVRGYVATRDELAAWLNPLATLKQLNAISPP